MKKDLLSFNAQVGTGSDLHCKFRTLFAFIFFFFITTFSAQEITVKSDAIITVTGDAFIYSKDKAFNEQISKNKDLQQNSNIEFIQNNELKISAKSKKKETKVLASNKKKTENIVLASKKAEKYKSVALPKKDIHFQVKDLDESSKFFAGSNAGNISFISPTNDYHLSKYFINSSNRFEGLNPISFLYKINCFYNNDNSTLQVFHNDFSVRPPPSGLIY